MNSNTGPANKKQILLILLLLSVILAATEIALHLSPYKRALKQIILPQFYLQADQAAGFDLSENFPPTTHRIADGYDYPIWSNALGCFDKPYQRQQGYILLTGDSFIWGYISFEDKYGTQLERYLGKRVLQAGVIGYGTRQETLKIKKIITLTGKMPALIILGYCLQNDFMDDWLFPRQTVINGFPIQNVRILDAATWEKATIPLPELTDELVKWEQTETTRQTRLIGRLQDWLKKHSILYCLTGKLFANLRVKTINPKEFSGKQYASFEEIMEKGRLPADGWDNHLENLKQLKNFCVQNNIPLLIVLIPGKEQIYNSSLSYKLLEEISGKLENFFKLEEIRYLNLTVPFRKYAGQHTRSFLKPHSALYWQADRHWNKQGHKLASMITAKYILDWGILDLPDQEKKLKILREETQNY